MAQRLAAHLSSLCCGLLAGAAIDASQTPPRAQFDSLEEHFKYGSVGIESEEGLPYWIWQVLPRVFADKLPGPAATIRSGSSGSPVTSCRSASRRSGSVRWSAHRRQLRVLPHERVSARPGGTADARPGGPGNLVDPQAYVRFLHTVADDPRFNAGELLKAIDGLTNLSWMQRMRYRMLLIPGTRSARFSGRTKNSRGWIAIPSGARGVSIRSIRSGSAS